MGVLSKLMPARQEPAKVVADLDALIDEPIAIRFQGRVFTVKPVSTRAFMKMADAMGRMQILTTQSTIKNDDVYKGYHDYISVLCPEITIDMLKSMTLTQVHALLNVLIKHSTGQPLNLDESIEKKRL